MGEVGLDYGGAWIGISDGLMTRRAGARVNDIGRCKYNSAIESRSPGKNGLSHVSPPYDKVMHPIVL